MSILAAAAWPSFVGLINGNKLSNSAYDLRAVMQQARTAAMTQNTYVWVGFYTTTKDGVPAVVVAAVTSKSGLVTDILSPSSYQPLMKPITFKNVALGSTDTTLPGLDSTNNTDAYAGSPSSAASFTLGLPSNSQATFTSVIAFSPDGQTSLPTTSAGTLALVRKASLGLNASPASANKKRTIAVQIQGLSGEVSVFQQ